jgi:uncharacterized membrane protein YdbT with pleckstrin-like domain
LVLVCCQLIGVFIVGFLGDVQLFSFLGVAVLLGSLIWFAWGVGDWWVERFVITDKRVMLTTGLLTKRVAIMPLSKVTDMTYERSVMGRLIGYGVFVMESAGQDQALSRIDYLPTPDLVYHDVSALLFGPKPGIQTPRSGPAAPPSTMPLPPPRQ